MNPNQGSTTPGRIMAKFQVSYTYYRDPSDTMPTTRVFTVSYPRGSEDGEFQRLINEAAEADLQSQLALRVRDEKTRQLRSYLYDRTHQY